MSGIWPAMLLVAAMWFGLSGAGTGEATAASMAGKRAILDETFQFWVTKDAADLTLSRIKEAGFNVYVPIVWYGAGTSWPSRRAPWDARVAGQAAAGADPLRYVIDKAHSMGIEVHPWFTIVLRQGNLLPEFALHGQSERGQLGIFDIHNPRFRAFIVDLIAEVVSNYEIDGVNLDYIRAMGLCALESCEREYRARYGRNLAVDTATFRVAPRLVPTLIEYQETAVTGLVREISERVRKLKPKIVISADVHPELTDYLQGQNSVEWANRGYVDVLFRMDYAKTIDVASTESVRRRLKNPDSMLIVTGNYDLIPNGALPRSGSWLVGTLREIVARWPRTGAAVYLYNQLSDEQVSAMKEWRTGLLQGASLDPANMPMH